MYVMYCESLMFPERSPLSRVVRKSRRYLASPIARLRLSRFVRANTIRRVRTRDFQKRRSSRRYPRMARGALGRLYLICLIIG